MVVRSVSLIVSYICKLFSCRELLAVGSPLVNDTGKVVAGWVSGLDEECECVFSPVGCARGVEEEGGGVHTEWRGCTRSGGGGRGKGEN